MKISQLACSALEQNLRHPLRPRRWSLSLANLLAEYGLIVYSHRPCIKIVFNTKKIKFSRWDLTPYERAIVFKSSFPVKLLFSAYIISINVWSVAAIRGKITKKVYALPNWCRWCLILLVRIARFEKFTINRKAWSVGTMIRSGRSWFRFLIVRWLLKCIISFIISWCWLDCKNFFELKNRSEIGFHLSFMNFIFSRIGIRPCYNIFLHCNLI